MSDVGFIRLDAVLADDLSVVNAARVSFGQKKKKLDEADQGLIKFLMREHHGTPFEHNFFRFHVRAPIFVTREWFRHRTGWSYNELSGRYSKIEPGAWAPQEDEVRTQVGKPGSYVFEPMSSDISKETKLIIEESNGHAWRTYNHLIGQGVAKEIARSVLPVSTYTEFYASCNARSLMHFCSLRNHPSAQKEIQWYAQEMEYHLAENMPHTHASFIEFKRAAP